MSGGSAEKTYSGVVGRELYISTTGTGKIAITMNVDDWDLAGETRDETIFTLYVSMFRHILKASPLDDLSAASFNVTIEVPEEMLQNEWEQYFKLSTKPAAEFRVSTEEIEDELTQFIPKVVEIPDAP